MAHRLGMRVYFSSYHLWASKHLIELASHIESKHTGRSRFDIRHRTYIINSILSSICFIEAAINELFQDAADEHNEYIQNLDEQFIGRLSDFWNGGEERKYSVLKKYNKALELCGKEQFAEDSNPYEDCDLARRLRNSIVHYRPETSFADEISKLEIELQEKFSLNPLITSPGNPLFPDKLLSSDCAIWAKDSCTQLANQFFDKLSIVPNYQRVSFE